MWSFEWRLRSCRRRNRAWQVWQRNGFSCEWVRRCDFRLWCLVNVWLQCWQVCLPREPPGVVAEGLKGVVGVVALKPGVVGVVAGSCSETLPSLSGCTESGNGALPSPVGRRSDGSVVLLLDPGAIPVGVGASPEDSVEVAVAEPGVLAEGSMAFAALAMFPRIFCEAEDVSGWAGASLGRLAGLANTATAGFGDTPELGSSSVLSFAGPSLVGFLFAGLVA